MSALAEAQRRFLESLVDPDRRDPATAFYADSLLRKRLRWARVVAHVSAEWRGAEFDEAFLAWARTHPLATSHRDDAIAFLATLPGRLARTEACALRARAMRAGLRLAWDGRSVLWWFRPLPRARMRSGRVVVFPAARSR